MFKAKISIQACHNLFLEQEFPSESVVNLKNQKQIY